MSSQVQTQGPSSDERVVSLGCRVEAGLQRVSKVLDDAVRERAESADLLHPLCGRLWRDLHDALGGKMMRPRLTLATYYGLGGADEAAIAPVAAAQELLHTALLVHDDLLDHDEVRRGRPNVAGATRARRAADGHSPRQVDEQATAAALLAGDAGLVAAFRLVTAAPLPSAARIGLVDLLARGVETTVAGELLDVAAELEHPAQVDALLVAELKTAGYSFRVPLVCGALAAGAGEGAVDVLARAGTALGLAYQLTDDELGVFGDSGATGKSVLSDLREGKRTELLRQAWTRTDDAGRAVLERHVGDPGLDESAARDVREVLRSSGALDATRELAAAAASRAAQEVAALPEPLGEYLRSVVDEICGRGR